ncbi:hypothetical protein CWI38_1302p0010 [Hamiltosporidium tvaerminnensis]|uniref:Uncharacterized protein n=1 Tax=Hamiltosporidium tvaerminnensis TaxID=1176355 RepID=A0A4Q9LRW0_9MICR|nr:hypothetical protein CWI38_1302p0010 [Hamiltosporidium tvaerminnensis]
MMISISRKIIYRVLTLNNHDQEYTQWDLENVTGIYNMVNASRYLTSTSRITASNIDKNIENDTEVCDILKNIKKES